MISLCLIVKQDKREARKLEECLASAAKWVDEICITTQEKSKNNRGGGYVEKVARCWGAKVSYFKWVDDFSKARDFNFSQASGDYILWLDADDGLKGGEYIKKMIRLMDENGVDIGIADYLYGFDEMGRCVAKHRKARIIKNDGCVQWKGKIHEDLIEQRRVKAYLMDGLVVIHKSDSERQEESKKRNLLIAIKNKTTDPKTIWDIANAYLGIGKDKEAIRFYSDFIKKSGSDEEKFLAWHRMSLAFLASGDYEEALSAELNALKLRPWYPDPYLGLGRIYFQMNDNKRAKEFLVQGLSKEVPTETAIAWNPRDYDITPLLMLSKVYFKLNQIENAHNCLMECQRISPEDNNIKTAIDLLNKERSEERRVGKECRSRWSPYH